MLAKIASGAVMGVSGYLIEIEVQLGLGLMQFHTVGLPDGAVREARVRVRSALAESGFKWPQRAITVNLAPADVRKDGTAFDLPIALALLGAAGQLPCDPAGVVLSDALVLGELGLSGEVRPVRGVLPTAVAARAAGLKAMIVPRANAAEASVVEGLQVVPVESLRELVGWVHCPERRQTYVPTWAGRDDARLNLDLQDVKGQEHAKRALEVAAAGGHNILLAGPPGSGKTMLARRLPSILPPLSPNEALEVTTVYSVAGLLGSGGLVTKRPFRAPHHTISDVGLIGGGSPSPRPGEVTLAHHGVLFLDELPEFRRSALEVLRQPLEDQSVSITRRLITVDYPAHIMLVAAMNGCPCGYLGSVKRACSCRPDLVERYRGRISGPLLDRIDIQVEVADVRYESLRCRESGANSRDAAANVLRARAVQLERFAASGIYCNAQMRPQELRTYCMVDAAGHRLLERVVDRLGMSARAHDRILKVSRTLADLDGEPKIGNRHLAEAVAYRCLDRSAPAQAYPSATP